MTYLIGELLDAGLLHEDVQTVVGTGLDAYRQEPKLQNGELVWEATDGQSQNEKILKTVSDPFQPTGGLSQLRGNIGRGVMKVSAVAPENRVVEAKARVFHDQNDVKAAFQNGAFTEDTVVVVRFQGPKAIGMPELHSLTPILSVLQDRGLNVAMVTDGRMSGASGRVPAAIHVCPEAAAGGDIAKIQDGDLIRVDAVSGVLEVLEPGFADRPAATLDQSDSHVGIGRELFSVFRANVGHAEDGAAVVL